MRTILLGLVLAVPSRAAGPAPLRDSLRDPSPRRRLLLIGGGRHPDDAMARFVASAKTEGARVLAVTWATAYPKESVEELRKELSPLGASVEGSAPDKAGFLAQLKRADAVFFCGGDQNRIMDKLKDAELLDALKRRYARGVPFAGTSAGTAIMSPIMITGEGDWSDLARARVETRDGLGLLSGVIVDQHFLKRKRKNRLYSLILKHPDLLGVGVDESSSLFVSDGRYAQALGGKVVLVQPAGAGLREDVLEPGERYDLKARKRL